ncbi:MAG: TspO/MBR family protein [Novosphingobium sp.]
MRDIIIGRRPARFWPLAAVFAPAILAAGFLSGRVAQSGPGNPWFDSLTMPPIYPPPVTFAIVWSALYLLMGLALALVVATRGTRGRTAALAAFAVQLALNLAWSPLFFAGHGIGAALALLIAIDAAVLLTVWLFWRVRRGAALLLLPYLAWVLFATVLNYEIWRLNPGA